MTRLLTYAAHPQSLTIYHTVHIPSIALYYPTLPFVAVARITRLPENRARDKAHLICTRHHCRSAHATHYRTDPETFQN